LHAEELVRRWTTGEGREIRSRVIDALLANADYRLLVAGLAGASEVLDHLDLRGLDLRGLALTGDIFVGASLDFARLDGCRIEHAYFDNTSLLYASFAEANIARSQFISVRATRASFHRAS
jgi:uncharacterized protein YjbI with pentapeptide repeats